MSYDAELGYDPERPVTISWEGDMHPKKERVESFRADDSSVWFTVPNGDETIHGGAPYTITVPWSRIYQIVSVKPPTNPTKTETTKNEGTEANRD